jgi:predicted DNA-binding transcriptional regulator AlpA
MAKRPSIVVPARCYTINQWCAARQISRTTFYELRKRGDLPNTYVVGIKTYISAEADNAWFIAREKAESTNSGRTAGGAK